MQGKGHWLCAQHSQLWNNIGHLTEKSDVYSLLSGDPCVVIFSDTFCVRWMLGIHYIYVNICIIFNPTF